MSLIKRIDTNRFPVLTNSLLDNFLTSEVDFIGKKIGSTASVNVVEASNEYRIEVVAPGLSKENFSIKVENENLTITGNEETRKEIKNEKYLHREFKSTSFQRTFKITEVIDSDKINAEYKDGILLVHLPKKEELKKKEEVKEIPIA